MKELFQDQLRILFIDFYAPLGWHGKLSFVSFIEKDDKVVSLKVTRLGCSDKELKFIAAKKRGGGAAEIGQIKG